jgi:hypothetical protein
MDQTLSRSPSPRDLLGSEHPFTRANDMLGVLLRQGCAVGLLLLGSIGALILGAAQAVPFVIGSSIVGLVLAALAGEQWDRRRFAARQLVLDGRESLPLAPVQRERRRLLEARTRHYMARSFERVLQHVTRRPAPVPAAVRPLFDVGTVSSVTDDLREIVRLLHSGVAHARGIALAERLLTEGVSPLYGYDAIALRDELRRVRYLLTA